MKHKTIEIFCKLVDNAATCEDHAASAGLSVEEYDRARRLIARAPNKVELGIIGALWSEHCSYKSSRAHLSKLPTKAEHVLVGPGENAGVVDIGDDLAVIFKIESHNHPSFVEPFQGAATGVGGILRDIFTMGARPFATANFLRFGNAAHEKVPYLLQGVVGGIAGYGNCFGVPTIKTNIDFHDSYNGNNLVNAFAIGVVNKHEIFLGSASGIQNRVLYVGAKTGRDGIMGAVMASDIFSGDTEAKRPTVQVGDPFCEKLLLEACFMAFAQKLVVGIQDMGAAGLACASFEMANRASTGLLLNLDDVPLRDETMSAYDIMLSESQERMLLVARPENVAAIKAIFDRFDLACADVGVVTGDGMVRIQHHGKKDIVNLSATLVIENAPRYRREHFSKLPYASGDPHKNFDIQEAIKSFKCDRGQADTSWITDQFDHHIGLNTLTEPNDADAMLIKVPESEKAVAISMTGNGRWLRVNPFEGARRTVFHALLEVSAQGSAPLGITNCLNFGSPENVSVMTDCAQTIDGMAHAASETQVPIISGNVSLYNETDGNPILPTLALTMVGLSKNPQRVVRYSHARTDDVLVVIGDLPQSLSGAEPILSTLAQLEQRPWDGAQIQSMASLVRRNVERGIIRCASVVGRGGMLHAIARLLHQTSIGVEMDFGSEWLIEEIAVGLLSEDSALIVVSIDDKALVQLTEECAQRVCLTTLGRVGGDSVKIRHRGDVIFAEHVNDFLGPFRHGLGELIAS